MRLMINICNEFAVFLERLLRPKPPAPGLTPDHLFALVAYKNFHLADFEEIPQRTSSLDRLEEHLRKEVRAGVESVQASKRERRRTEEQRERREEMAAKLGNRVRALIDTFPVRNARMVFRLDGHDVSLSEDGQVKVWQAAAAAGSLTLVETSPYGQQDRVIELGGDAFGVLFPELRDAAWWLDPEAAELARLTEKYDADIAFLQGAGFAELARYERAPAGGAAFGDLIDQTLLSELARDLVRQGFLTRNYAEYSTVFYGNFVGVDVAFFYNHSVQPNVMYLDHQFANPDVAIPNLLEQVPEHFTNSVSALNIQVVSYIMRNDPARSARLAGFVATHAGNPDVRTFLTAIFNTPKAPAARLVRLLVKHPWRGVFDYIAEHAELDEKTRCALLDAAVLGVGEDPGVYDLGDAARKLLTSTYTHLKAVQNKLPEVQTARIFALLQAVDLVVAELNDVSEPLRRLFVEDHRYEMDLVNLKLALGIDGVPTLDAVRRVPVWDFCLARLADYLRVARRDSALREAIVTTEATLIDILNQPPELWKEVQLVDLLLGATATAVVGDIEDLPKHVWPAAAQTFALAPTVANINAYVAEFGVDSSLAAFLADEEEGVRIAVELQGVESVAAATRRALAISVLNAPKALDLPAKVRVELVAQLELDEPLVVTDVAKPASTADHLLARALEKGLLPDELSTFTHFAQGGWEAIEGAFGVSKEVRSFLDPALIAPVAADFLTSPAVPDDLQRRVVEDMDSYVPDDVDALLAAGRFAEQHRMQLKLHDVKRVAIHTRAADVVVPLLVRIKSDLDPAQLVEVLAELGPLTTR